MAHVWITSKLASLAICIAGLMSTSHLVASYASGHPVLRN